jgi:hypothetical protein
MATPQKGQADYYSDGDFNAYCSMCGRKRKASTMDRNWQGLYRCPVHNEARQPQDFVRGVKDDTSVPWAQILSDNDFVFICSINTQCSLPGFGLPGCMMPGNSHFDPYGL